MEAVRTEVFTHPATQISGFRPLAGDFDWAVWVGFKPGVRDNAGAVAREAIEAYLGRKPAAGGGGLYFQTLTLFRGQSDRDQCARVARELLANDHDPGIPPVLPGGMGPGGTASGSFSPGCTLSTSPQVAVFDLSSLDSLRGPEPQRHLALRDADLPIIRDYFQRPEVLARRA